MNLKNKNILLGVTGGIAIYKSPGICSILRKMGANVKVVMTEHATKFVQPLTFMTMTDNHVYVGEFHDKYVEPVVEHIELAKWADIIVIAPASANIIAKYANGIGDDLLSTILLAARSPVMIVPAMNTVMLNAPATRRNIYQVQEYGATVLGTAKGVLACSDVGDGKMLEPDEIVTNIKKVLSTKDLKGKRILVTAGPTIEAIDPVRYLTNHSSGKMGYAIAEAATMRGAEVILISGPTNIKAPDVYKFIPITSTLELYDAVNTYYDDVDVVIKAAAPADYRPASYSEDKLKKKSGDMNTIKLTDNPDILKNLGKTKSHQILIGFAAESQNEVANATEKLKAKNLDLIVVNNITKTGFKSDDNQVTIISKDESVQPLPMMDKSDLADTLLDEIKKLF